MQSSKVSRTRYLVDRPFQLKHAGMLAMFGAILFFLFGAMVYAAPPDAAGKWLILSVLAVFVAVSLGLYGILLTHRVAGPIRVLGHYMTVFARGRYPIFRPLRKSDELKFLFEEFQRAVEALRAKELEEIDVFEKALNSLAPYLSAPEIHQTHQALSKIQQRRRDATDRIDLPQR